MALRCRRILKTDHHDRAGHRRGAVPRVPVDRKATGAPGKNWLFFGHQRSDCDFFYSDELNAMKTSGLLTRMSLAWSRDGDKKFYVQDACAKSAAIVDLAGRRRQHLYLRRRQADGQGRRTRAGPISSPSFGRARPTRLSALSRNSKKKGRFQQDVY